MPGRTSGIKMVRMAEMGAPISLDGVAVHPDCWCLPVIFILLKKIQKMAKCTFWYWLTWVDPDIVQTAVKWLCVYVSSHSLEKDNSNIMLQKVSP